jgi:hypothetical protein
MLARAIWSAPRCFILAASNWPNVAAQFQSAGRHSRSDRRLESPAIRFAAPQDAFESPLHGSAPPAENYRSAGKINRFNFEAQNGLVDSIT